MSPSQPLASLPATPEEPQSTSDARERSLRASVRDGVATSVMVGAGENYFGAFGVFLNGTAFQIGALSALPPLFGALSQGVSVFIMERLRSRRTLIVTCAFLQGLLWSALVLIALLRPNVGVALLIATVIGYHSLGGLTTPVWNSLIGDLVPPAKRGAYFGYRSKCCGLATFIALILAGQVLHYFSKGQGALSDASALGFAIIFGVAGFSRLLGSRQLAQHEDPPYHFNAKQHAFSFWQFVRRTRYSNFAKFVFFVSSVNLGVALAGPFFAIYQLRVLQLTYWQFTLIAAGALVAQYLTLEHWGSLSDRFGSKKILNLCSVGVGILPLLWLFTAQPLVLFLIQLYGGFVWAGFNLAAGNFMFDAVSPPKRARCVAFQSIINGSFVFAGSMIGAFLAESATPLLPPVEWLPYPESPYLFLFLVSGVVRLAAAGFFLPLVREVRVVEGVRHRDLLFQIASFRPNLGATFALVPGRRRRTPQK